MSNPKYVSFPGDLWSIFITSDKNSKFMRLSEKGKLVFLKIWWECAQRRSEYLWYPSYANMLATIRLGLDIADQRTVERYFKECVDVGIIEYEFEERDYVIYVPGVRECNQRWGGWKPADYDYENDSDAYYCGEGCRRDKFWEMRNKRK